jgi:hypothetical protein
VLNAVLELFAEKPERYSVHRIRGTEPEVTKSEVVQLEGSTVDLGSMLVGKETGRYKVQFVPLSEKATRSTELQSLQGEINWNPGQTAVMALGGIQPGLYEVRVYRGTMISTAWVLLCAAECETSVVSFKEFARQTESWGRNVTQETKQAYQRAYLEYLDLRRLRLDK